MKVKHWLLLHSKTISVCIKSLLVMTGTAKTEEKNSSIFTVWKYCLFPPNKPLARVDCSDQTFKTKAAKYRAVVRGTL